MFYRKENDSLLKAENEVVSKDYHIKADEKDSYEYPVHGWYWFETDEEA